MKTKLKLSALAVLAAAFATTARADTNLLQSVSVAFAVYSQGTPVVHGTTTNNVVNKTSFNTKNLINDLLAPTSFTAGDLLVRVTPVTNVTVDTTNIAQVSTTDLIVTNASTNIDVADYQVIFNDHTNDIGSTNLTFGTNIETIGGNAVTLGTNTASAGTNLNFVIGTNTTVTITTQTNDVGIVTATNYAFAINSLTVIPGTNKLGTAYWAVYNTINKSLTTISSNVFFNITTDHVYDGTNLAYIHGETIKPDGVVRFGTTDEIRTFVLTNSSTHVKLEGFAHGQIVVVSTGRTASAAQVNSQNYHWEGSGSGIVESNVPVVLNGAISETFYKVIKSD